MIRSLFVDAGKGETSTHCNGDILQLLMNVIAELPQEQGGIKVPPDVTSSAKEENDTETTRVSIEEAYKEYIDVLVSEALVFTPYIAVVLL